MRVGIIGGGASAVSILRNLHNSIPIEITVFTNEPIGPGRAYSEESPSALLNRQASGMSIDADNPDHFQHWLEEHYSKGPESFVPRSIYGHYLRDQVTDFVDNSVNQLSIIDSRVIDITHDKKDSWILTFHACKGTYQQEFDAVVLATGTSIPGDPYKLGGTPNYHADVYPLNSWCKDATNDPLAIIGTGLSGVDAAIAVSGTTSDRRMTMASRHGIIPDVRAFSDECKYNREISNLINTISDHRNGLSWQDVTQILNHIFLENGVHPNEAIEVSHELELPAKDRLKPNTKSQVEPLNPEVQKTVINIANNYMNDLWSNMRSHAKQRFLDQFHNTFQALANPIPPETALSLFELVSDSRLSIRSNIQNIEYFNCKFAVHGKNWSVSAREVVNATKMPEGNLTGVAGSLLSSIIFQGIAQKHPFGGLRIDPHTNHIIAANGITHKNLYAIGEITVGSVYYISSIAKIRERAKSIATQLSSRYNET